MTPHVTEEPSGTFMSTILNSAVEANLKWPKKISEEMKVPEYFGICVGYGGLDFSQHQYSLRTDLLGRLTMDLAD
jgi:hypothetical protein